MADESSMNAVTAEAMPVPRADCTSSAVPAARAPDGGQQTEARDATARARRTAVQGPHGSCPSARKVATWVCAFAVRARPAAVADGGASRKPWRFASGAEVASKPSPASVNS